MMDIKISNMSSVPIYQQVATQIKNSILNGSLKCNDQLPSIRSLSKELEVGIITVKKSYEVLLQEELIPFIRQIKELGYAVKLDTNGTNNEKLGVLLEEGLVDFVSLDMKNSAEKYPLTSGLKSDMEYKHPISESVRLLQEYKVEHEFKTTVVKEFHTVDDLIKIAKFIGSDAHYVLQQFVSSDSVIQPDLHAYTAEEMVEMKKAVEPYMKTVELRLVKEV